MSQQSFMKDSSRGTMIPTTTGTLHTSESFRRTTLNRLFATVYTCALLLLLYNHTQTLSTKSNLFISLSLLISDLILIFMWTTLQAFRMCPVRRRSFPDKLLEESCDINVFPCMDVFICTADPYKEPPIGVVNTALSVMAYDYPTDKISVYVSDDGGSKLTLFAFMEAAKFAKWWVPFCRKKKILERSPRLFFESKQCSNLDEETQEIKSMYEMMKLKVDQTVETGQIMDEYICLDEEREIFDRWRDDFTRKDHPTIIQVLLDSSKHKDITGQHYMPNLIYVSREKSSTSPHHFKAGALNALLRVSAAMTNAPVILTLDCDMCSSNPQAPLHALCYFSDPALQSKLAFVQFPQRFRGINKADTYACEFKLLFEINPKGFDGLSRNNYVGTGCFFRRRALYGSPECFIQPEIPELGPDHVVPKPTQFSRISALAHRAAACDYEMNTKWGYKIGFRYGSLVEDFFTGYCLHCEGWKSIFCNPDKVAFFGDAPNNLIDIVSQQMRWAYGLYELALLNGLTIFPKVSEPRFLLYAFLFLGSYFQDLIEFLLSNGTCQRWWSDQRIWLIRGLSSHLFGSIEFLFKSLGISTFAFNVTSKVVDDEQNKRYNQGILEFGTHSPMFLPLIFLSGFAVVNSWPVYEAMVLRKDKGKCPTKTCVMAAFLALGLYALAFLFLRH
ncbi:hypothetical protein ACFE04_006666 [Oxalis oulophora]